MQLSTVDIVGAGPAGRYAATLIKRAMPGARVTVREQNPSDATFGFGVVFSDQALDFLKADDPETHDLITPHMERWRNMTLVLKGEKVTIDGIGFAAIGRLHLLQLLQQRARDEGVELAFGTPVVDLAALDAELVIGADGLNSLVRRTDEAAFETALSHFDNRFAWFGTTRPFDTLTQTFVETRLGALNAHHYRYTPDRSTFIVECDAATFAAYGFEAMDEDSSARICEEIFADTLEGAPLVTNRSIWRRFPKLWCGRWASGNRAILGDAAHTAHFSIGSGTRLAMEDAIALVRALQEAPDLDAALETYQRDRLPIARKIVTAANTSAGWYDQFADKLDLAPLDFGFDYITRSGRVDMDRLRKLAPDFIAAYEAHHLRSASLPRPPAPSAKTRSPIPSATHKARPRSASSRPTIRTHRRSSSTISNAIRTKSLSPARPAPSPTANSAPKPAAGAMPSSRRVWTAEIASPSSLTIRRSSSPPSSAPSAPASCRCCSTH